MTELELWKLAVPELDDDGLLNKICLDIATDMDQHNKIIDGILQKDSLFEYTPLFGTGLKVNYQWDKKQVVLERLGQSVSLEMTAWFELLAKIDLVFSDVLPIGSVIEVDGEKTTPELREIFESQEDGIGFYLQIVARKVAVETSDNYVDYLATVWPVGMQPLVQPIFISNYLIKSVIAKGYTNEFEKKYAKGTKLNMLLKKRHSILLDMLLGMLEDED